MIRITHLGPSHFRTADSHFNLGLLFRLQGEFEEALEHLGYALGIREKLEGADSTGSTGIVTIALTERAIGKCFESLEHAHNGEHNGETMYDLDGDGEDDSAVKAFLNYDSSHRKLARVLGDENEETVRTLVSLYQIRFNRGLYSNEEFRVALSKVSSSSSSAVDTISGLLASTTETGFLALKRLKEACGYSNEGQELLKVLVQELDLEVMRRCPEDKSVRARVRAQSRKNEKLGLDGGGKWLKGCCCLNLLTSFVGCWTNGDGQRRERSPFPSVVVDFAGFATTLRRQHTIEKDRCRATVRRDTPTHTTHSPSLTHCTQNIVTNETPSFLSFFLSSLLFSSPLHAFPPFTHRQCIWRHFELLYRHKDDYRGPKTDNEYGRIRR